MLYVARQRMAIMGKVYNPGDESDLEDVAIEYLAYLLGRGQWWPVDGLESLDDDLLLLVLEEQG